MVRPKNISFISFLLETTRLPAYSRPARSSLCLAAQKRRNIQLILITRVMHRALPAMLVEALRRRAAGVFGDWQVLSGQVLSGFVSRWFLAQRLLSQLLPRFGRPRHRATDHPLGRNRAAHCGADRRCGQARFLVILVAAAKTDRG